MPVKSFPQLAGWKDAKNFAGVLDKVRTSLYKDRAFSERGTKPGLIAKRAQIAQLVEQRIENPRVGGSIPPLGTTLSKKS